MNVLSRFDNVFSKEIDVATGSLEHLMYCRSPLLWEGDQKFSRPTGAIRTLK